ncbi:MAG: DUF1540 domain-containing protein [Chloroflexaceae bacterium]|nr:DUF1540 domain-containing protein [Chloroflexaceae bacterium]NJO06688.1 DUF1540 domain-containing protein [Chloroflexaceae bacterium]
MNTETQTNQQKDVQTSTVTACAATSCRYNENQQCTAGTIQLVVKNDMPACGTYTAR